MFGKIKIELKRAPNKTTIGENFSKLWNKKAQRADSMVKLRYKQKKNPGGMTDKLI